MNLVIKNIKERRSIRKYKDKKIPKKVIDLIIEAGKYAPSSHNSQPWRFIVIENKKMIKKCSEAVKDWFKSKIKIGKVVGVFNKKIKSEVDSAKKRLGSGDMFFYGAPLLVLICAKPGRFTAVDCACAAENMMLAAQSVGVGSCWIGFADISINNDLKLMEKLGVPSGHKIFAHLIFGYPEKFSSTAYPRKDEAKVVKWIK